MVSPRFETLRLEAGHNRKAGHAAALRALHFRRWRRRMNRNLRQAVLRAA